MAKSPELGKVKTRLAKSIGDEEALKIYSKLLNYTFRESNCALWETAVHFKRTWDKTLNTFDFEIKPQSEGELGERMEASFHKEFKDGADRVVMIGADCPEISLGHIERAFGMLKLHDVVIGPASDGGYYLIAMNEVHPEILKDVPWSTDHVFEITKELAQENNLSIGLLETLTDIDTQEDLANHSWLMNEK